MTQESTRDVFERDLKANPYDEATRKIYADWLDEHDEPEYADYQRNWTAQAYEEARCFFVTFAANAEMTYDEVVEGATDYYLTGDHIMQYGSESARDEYSNHKLVFWQYFHTLTGKPIEQASSGPTNPFGCSC